jgi:hypothetical protein
MARKPDAAPPGLAPLTPADGMPFAAWMEREGLARSTAYQRASELGIRRAQRHNPETGRPDPWLSQADAEALTAYARMLREGVRPAEAVAALGRGVIVPAVAEQSPESTESTDTPADYGRLELLALRMRALRDAVELGAPLSRADAAALLGVVPGAGVGEAVTRAGIEAHHLARGVWQLRRAEASRARPRN